jgi:hypothetical protein
MQKTTAGVRVDLDATKLMLCLLLFVFFLSSVSQNKLASTTPSSSVLLSLLNFKPATCHRGCYIPEVSDFRFIGMLVGDRRQLNKQYKA